MKLINSKLSTYKRGVFNNHVSYFCIIEARCCGNYVHIIYGLITGCMVERLKLALIVGLLIRAYMLN